ncbi:MAG: ribbon-helix-helix domain-containing protein, partial [Proteobacteria bacterium]|nr:ribbon-helix-helix domain-containing protein [Pseudomonadota bacterium]
MKQGLITKNVTVGNLRTSLRLESEIWAALDEICAREGLTVHQLCTLVDDYRRGNSRTSAVR